MQGLACGTLGRALMIGAAAATALVVAFHTAAADKVVRLSIATGGTGGVYYPLGGAVAAALSKHLPNVQATAEVTGGSIDNLKLIAAGRAEIGFTMADASWDGFQGMGKFNAKLPIRAIAVLYPNNLQVVTLEGRGIAKMADLKGKRLSTGSPGSGTEVMALRLMEAYDLLPDRDFKRERLSVAESVNAIKDGKIDALIWSGGIPTAAITDLAATPGVKMRLIDHGDAVAALRRKYGPLYVDSMIPAGSYRGQDAAATNVDVWNLLVVNEGADEKLVYDVVKTLFERKGELVAVHREAAALALESQLAGGSPIPFHPGALRYFAEKGVKSK
jgi:TRAP transporter TAXI family solute receptor